MGGSLIPERYGRRAAGLLILLPVALLIAPRAAAEGGASVAALDPTLQALLQLGPTGALLGAAYLLGRWQPRISIELSADPALRRALRRALDEPDDPSSERPRPPPG